MTNHISASQAISPAYESTKLFLLKPFRLWTFLKFTLVALLTEGGFTSCNFNSGSGFPKGNGGGANAPFHLPNLPSIHAHWPAVPIILGISLAVILIVLPIGILISYLLIRLRFSFFDCLLHRQHLIGAAWSRYHRQSVRYLGLTVLIGLGSWAAMAIFGYFLYEHFKPLWQSLFSGGKPNFVEFLPVIGMAAPFFILLTIVLGLLNVALGDFILPRMALEDASIQDSLTDVWADVKTEPGQFALFIVLRFLLAMIGTIIGSIAIMVPLVILAGIGVLLVIAVKAISTPLAFIVGIPAAVILFGLFILCIIGVGGSVGTFRRMYGMFFYSGRYQPLADILQPPPPPVWQPGFYPNAQPGNPGNITGD